jgi:hypothetical protein
MAHPAEWTVFVVWHKSLQESRYTCDPSFDHNRYVFLKVNPRYTSQYNAHFGYRVAYEHVLPYYQDDLHERTYMMPGVIYNVYMSRLHAQMDYIGFMEYDIPLQPGTTALIQQLVNQRKRCLIPLSYRNSFRRLAKQAIHRLRGRQCMFTILSDFNAYFNTAHTMEELWDSNPTLVTQQSFITDRRTFGELGEFLAYVVHNKLAEARVSGDWTRPSTLLDRYIGLALYLLAPREPVQVPVPLPHDSEQGWLLEKDQ